MLKLRQVLSVFLLGAALLGTLGNVSIQAQQTPAAQSVVANQPQPAAPAESSRAGILTKLRAAKENIRPLDQTRVQERRAELAQALADLQRTLSNSPSDYEEGWKAYLKWNELTAAASNEISADPKVLRVIQEKLSRNHSGLELNTFVRVRDRLRAFANSLEASRHAKPDEAYANVINDLTERFERYQTQPIGSEIAEIARHLSWLESVGREPEIIQHFQQEFAVPNFEIDASAAFLARVGSRPVDQVTTVNDVILKTRLNGTAHMVGQTSITPAESLRSGLLCLNLVGTVNSNNCGVNGPATIHTTAVTSVQAVKPIQFDVNGVMLLPATANCTTNSTIHSIQTHPKFIEKMAWKRAGKQKGQSEAIASQHAEQRVAKQLDFEVAKQIAGANALYENKLRKPALRRGIWPKATMVSSNTQGVQVRLLHVSAGQLAAPSVAPGTTKPHDITVKAHESAVANLSTELIGGFELTDENVVRLLQENNREVPEELKITENSEPWSITFARYSPVSVSFDANQIRVGVRCERFTKGKNDDGSPDQEINAMVEISANYRLYQGTNGIVLTRDGEVTVDFVGQKKLSTLQVATKTFLKRKFNSVFKPEIVGEGIALKSPIAGKDKLVICEVSTHQGWLVAGIE